MTLLTVFDKLNQVAPVILEPLSSDEEYLMAAADVRKIAAGCGLKL
jgi:hypothetical protein